MFENLMETVNISDSETYENFPPNPIIKPPKLIKRPGSSIDSGSIPKAQIGQIIMQNELLHKENSEMKNKITLLETQIEEIMGKIKNKQKNKVDADKQCNKSINNTNNSIHNVEAETTVNGLPLNDNDSEMCSDEHSSIDDEGNEFIPVLRRQNRNKYNKNQIKSQSNKNKNVNDNKPNNNENNNKHNSEIKKKVKMPPINIYVQTPNQTATVLEMANIKDFTMQRINQNKHILYMASTESYYKAKELLNDVCTQYYTYTPKESKPKNLLLKGLSSEEDTNELLMDLKTHETEELKFINCVQFESNISKTKKNKLAIYLIQFSAESNLNIVYKIQYIRHQRIKWEKIKSSDNVMQCKNCQRFGHSAINCNLPYRCVKCDKEHDPKQCKVKKMEDSTAYCTNCKEMGHPASFRGCPIYKNIIKKIQEAKLLSRQKAQRGRRFNSSYIKPGVNYSDLFNTNKMDNTSNEKITSNNQNNKNFTNNNNISEQILQKLDEFKKYMIDTDKRIETLFNAINSIMNE